MSKRDYLIRKYFEPSGEYADTLSILPGTERDLAPDMDGLIVKSRLMDASQARIIEQRSHVEHVELAQVVRQKGNAVEENVGLPSTMFMPDASAFAANPVTLAETKVLHRVKDLHQKGYTGQGEVIAVLDTGISEHAHAALHNRIVYAGSMINGEDWRDTKSMHGTWCISAIAEHAPGAKLISIKVLSTQTGSGSSSGIISGINEAIKQGATIISMSLGGSGNPSDSMCAAVDAARERGVLVPVAAGNEQRNSTAYNADFSSPGCAKGAICCGASDRDFEAMPFSNWGATVECMGIGGLITETPFTSGSWSGTSMSTPLVAGSIACLGSRGDLHEIVNKAFMAGLRDNAQPAYVEGGGTVDAVSSFNRITTPTNPAPTPSPTPPAPAPPKERRLYKKLGYFNDKGDFVPGSEGPKRAYLQPMRDGSVRWLAWEQYIVED
jgi:subtilisin family serine protease